MKRLPGMKLAVFPLLLLAFPAVADNAPIRAVSEEVRQYLSPMELELDLREFLAMAPGTTWKTQAIARFSCRLVTFEYLMLTADTFAPTKVRFLSLVKNNSGKDKRVQMAFATGERCVVKISPDAKAVCAGVLEHTSPTVRLVVTVDDF